MRARALIISSFMLSCVAIFAAPAVASSGGASAPSAGAAQASPGAGSPSPSSGAGQTPAGGASGPASTGGSAYGSGSAFPTNPTVPGYVAQIVHGIAYAPASAPLAVQRAIWTANYIIGRPYVYGGGHNAFQASGYDCSGTVSYALHGGGLLRTPMDSSEFARFGKGGAGQWITVYTNPGHAYMVIAGIRLDTSAADDPHGGKGPRWRRLRRNNRGFQMRHPLGL